MDDGGEEWGRMLKNIKRKREEKKCWREFFCFFQLPFFLFFYCLQSWDERGKEENTESEEIFTVISCNLNSTFRALYWLSLAFLKSFMALNKGGSSNEMRICVCMYVDFPSTSILIMCLHQIFFPCWLLFTLPAMPFFLIVLYCI